MCLAASLLAVVPGNQRSEFTYAGFSRRTKLVEKLSGTVQSTKQFVWVGGEIAEERDGSNAVQKKFFGPGEWRNGVGNLNYSRDHLGNLRELTDGSSVVRARYEYDPYGRRSANLITGGSALAADWGFTGHYYHAPSTLHLAWFRAYDANLGRWISRDPIEEDGGLNVYAYANHDPVNYVDPDGQAPHVWVGRAGYLLGGLIGDYLYDKYVDPMLDDYLAEHVDPDVAANLQRLREAADMARMLKNPAKLGKKLCSSKKPVGSHSNTHASGKKYHGKGDEERTNKSAKEKGKEYNDPVVHQDFKPAANNREAFKDEARRIRDDGGVTNPDNYNKINSPGEKYLKQDGE